MRVEWAEERGGAFDSRSFAYGVDMTRHLLRNALCSPPRSLHFAFAPWIRVAITCEDDEVLRSVVREGDHGHDVSVLSRYAAMGGEADYSGAGAAADAPVPAALAKGKEDAVVTRVAHTDVPRTCPPAACLPVPPPVLLSCMT